MLRFVSSAVPRLVFLFTLFVYALATTPRTLVAAVERDSDADTLVALALVGIKSRT